jgi:DNA-binding NarL/FixJ family response regulator
VELVGFGVVTAGILAAVASLLLRFRVARAEQRQQLKWFAYAAALMGVFIVENFTLHALGSPLVGTPFHTVPALLAYAAIATAAGIAILRYHLYDIDVIMFEDDSSVLSAMRAGARGYLLKGATHAEMARAIRAVGEGEAIFSPAIAARLRAFFASVRPAAVPQVFPELSDREREILDLIVLGYKNPEIAARLVLSPKTVRNHVTNILSKLQVADRVEAVIRAREAGLGQRSQ